MPRKVKTQSDNASVQLTQAGLDELVQELADRKQKQLEIASEIQEAKELGDLKENEPYAEAMKKKEINDARIDELEYVISKAQVVESSAKGIAGIGSTVEIQRVGSKAIKTIKLVGKEESQEADPSEGKVSIDSPVGNALNSAKTGDTVKVALPVGEVSYKVLKVA